MPEILSVFHTVSGELPENMMMEVTLVPDQKPKKGGKDKAGRRKKGKMIDAKLHIDDVRNFDEIYQSSYH